jgi:hypothetical protein
VALICNTILPLSVDKMDAKASLASASTSDILQAVSDCFKASEMLQSEQKGKPSVVYLCSAKAKLATAAQALVGVREIMRSAPPSEEAIDWISNLDLERLYRQGVGRGVIPEGREQWSRLAQIVLAEDYLGVVDSLIKEIQGLQLSIDALIDCLEIPNLTTSDGGKVQALVKLHTSLANFLLFEQFVAYLNGITPLDPAWINASRSTPVFVRP